MNPVMRNCPVCSEPLSVTRLHCRSCDTTIEGHFEQGRLARLSPSQIEFVETFIRCEGKFNRMEGELDLSYPTLRARLTEIIRRMGFPVGSEKQILSDEERTRILDDLANGKLSPDEAMSLLSGD